MRLSGSLALGLAALTAAGPAFAGGYGRRVDAVPAGCVSLSRSRAADAAYYGHPGSASGFFGWPGVYYTSDGYYNRMYRPHAYSAVDVYTPAILCGVSPSAAR